MEVTPSKETPTVAPKPIPRPIKPGDAKSLVQEARDRLRRLRKRLPTERVEELRGRIDALDAARRAKDAAAMATTAAAVEADIEGPLAAGAISKLREYVESIGLAIVFALLLRGFVVEAFEIPSGSMEPTLLVGDRLFVAKYTYGIRVPFTTSYLLRWRDVSRGDVVVFEFPRAEAQTQVNIGVVTRWLETYRRTHGGFPGSLADLRDPATGEGPDPNALRDAWGQPFQYRLEVNGFSLVSPGPDGLLGTGDELDQSNSAFYNGVGSCVDAGSLTGNKDYIKRVVGVEGDTIEVREGVLHINGVALSIEDPQPGRTSANFPMVDATEIDRDGNRYVVRSFGSNSSFGPITVRPGHVFTMGDSRDNSSDGRCWGQVPLANIKGASLFIFFSRDLERTGRVRWDRILNAVR